MKILSEKKSFYRVVYILVILFVLFLIIKTFSSSLFVKTKDRVNLLIYDREPQYYSFSQLGAVDYTVYFNPDDKIQVPGGYGAYRFGALGWLVKDQRQPTIFKKAFSTATSSMVDFYFYKGDGEIYYGGQTSKKAVSTPNFYKLLFYRSNANFFDRLYLWLKVVAGGRNSISMLPYKDSDSFLKSFQGYLYQKTYRTENKNVKVIYSNSYNSAYNIVNILAGNGINVGDISEQKGHSSEACEVVEDGVKFSQTSRDISSFLGCKLRKSDAGVFDIIVVLGRKEAEWEVN